MSKGISSILIYGAICIFSQFFVHTLMSETNRSLYYRFVNSLTSEELAFLLWSLDCKLNYAKSIIIGSISGISLFIIGISLFIYTKMKKVERRESSILIFATYEITFIVFSIISDPHLMMNITDPSLMICFGAILSAIYYLHVHEFKIELSQTLSEIHSKWLRVKYLEMKGELYKEHFRSMLGAFVALFAGVIAIRLYQISVPISPLILGTREWALSFLGWFTWIVELVMGCIAILSELLGRIDQIQKQILHIE